VRDEYGVNCVAPIERLGVPPHGDDWSCGADGRVWSCWRDIDRWFCRTREDDTVHCIDGRREDDLAEQELECLAGTTHEVCCGAAPLAEAFEQGDESCFAYRGLRCCAEGWRCEEHELGLDCVEAPPS
jgi:hypothetical protein